MVFLTFAFSKGDATLILTGSVHGQLDPCGWPNKPLGGLSRKYTTLKNMKKEGLSPIVLDAGDLLFAIPALVDSNRNSETARAAAMLNDNKIHPFDAINVGKYEFAGGVGLLQKLSNKTKSNFISANLRDSNSGRLLFNPYRIIERNDITFWIIGLMDMISEEVDGVLQDDYIVSGDKYIMKIKEKVDIIVLMINSERSTYSILISFFPLANIILTSGSTMLTRPMMT